MNYSYHNIHGLIFFTPLFMPYVGDKKLFDVCIYVCMCKNIFKANYSLTCTYINSCIHVSVLSDS